MVFCSMDSYSNSLQKKGIIKWVMELHLPSLIPYNLAYVCVIYIYVIFIDVLLNREALVVGKLATIFGEHQCPMLMTNRFFCTSICGSLPRLFGAQCGIIFMLNQFVVRKLLYFFR